MKVLIVASQLHFGAAELLAVELAVDLNKHGIHADITCMYSGELRWARDARTRLLKRGVPEIHFLGLPLRPSAVRLLPAIMKLRGLIRRGKIDIVETSSPALGLLASLACAGTAAIHVAGLHQTFYATEHGLRERLFAFCTKMRKRTTFYAVSEFAKKAWVEYSGADSERVRVIYNGMAACATASDPDNIRRSVRLALGIPEDSKVLLCAGNFSAFKRQDLVVDALAPICDKENLTILFAGNIDKSVPEMRAMLRRVQATVSSSDLNARVRILGHRSDVRQLMLASDLLVHASRREAFGLVLTEAMAAGLPIVASNTEAIPEIAADTDTILVPPDDAVALRNSVLKALARSPELVTKAKAKGKSRAAIFSQAARTAKMVQLFQDAVAEREFRMRS